MLRIDTATNPLARLIATRKEERGFTYGQIAKKGELPKSTVYKLATRETWQYAPSTDTLDRLAAGLELPVKVVRQAAADTVGLTAAKERDDDLGILVGSIESLTPEQRAQVTALVDAMVRQNLS